MVLLNQIADALGMSRDIVTTAYIALALVTCFGMSLFLIFKHYRNYYLSLKTYVEEEKDIRYAPRRNIESDGVVGGIVGSVLSGALWPIMLCIGMGYLLVILFKWIVNIPGNYVEKKVVEQQQCKMLTSSNEHIRNIAIRHSKRKQQ